MKRDFIIYKVFCKDTLLQDCLQIAANAGILELVENEMLADFAYNINLNGNTEMGLLLANVIRKSIIDFVFEIMYIRAETMDDYGWIVNAQFWGEECPVGLAGRILDRQIHLLSND